MPVPRFVRILAGTTLVVGLAAVSYFSRNYWIGWVAPKRSVPEPAKSASWEVFQALATAPLAASTTTHHCARGLAGTKTRQARRGTPPPVQ